MNRREIILGGAALAACSQGPAPAQGMAPAFPMRRGVNLGNALEAPAEGEWGYRIERAHLDAIAAAGFDGVRIPVRWTTHLCTGDEICADFFARIDEVLDWALAAGLKAQLDLHHYEALLNLHDERRLIAPGARHKQRFLAIWSQIAARYASLPDALMFEPMNEPNGRYWDGEALAALQAEVVAIIRKTNPSRPIVLGPANWQNINALERWRLPSGENLYASVHYYEPHAFTHQNAEWLSPAPRYERDWGGEADVAQVRAHIDAAAAWGRAHGASMQLGEFGVNARARLAQRALWTAAVREACEAHGMGWCVWDFAGAFPLWDRVGGVWMPEMLEALFS